MDCSCDFSRFLAEQLKSSLRFYKFQEHGYGL
jgi:hypothetical protein